MRSLLSIWFLSMCYGITINVPADSSTIQAGIQGAQAGDTVLVSAETTYEENIIWPATNGIKLICNGEEYCIIDGDSLASVIRFEEELGGIIDTNTLIRGFAMRNGYAQGDYPHDCGGGMYLHSSSPAIDGVTINGNTANFGGGILLEESSSPILTNMTISGNNADFNGGAMYHYSSSNPDLENVIIENNTAAYYGGGMYLNSSNSTLSLMNVTIRENTATVNGGGMYIKFSNPSLTNVTISENSVTDNGGGMYLHSSNPSLNNIIITGNTATVNGGGMYLNSSSPILTNVTISANTANENGGGMYFSASTSILQNSILWGNSSQAIYPSGVTINIYFSDIQGGWEGEGNIDSDPNFTDSDNGDFTLQEGSPCIDGGDPTSPYDPDGTRSDMGATYFHQCSYGDINSDEGWSILDIVILINCVLADECEDLENNGCAGDLNGDGGWSILDIIILINCVLVDECEADFGGAG